MARKIIIFSAKGGVGKSFIAVNLAASLAKNLKKKVLLFDLDLDAAGDIAWMLNINKPKALVEQVSKASITHTAFGLDFIGGVLHPRQVPQFNKDNIIEAFNLFDSSYDYFVVDAGDLFTENLITCLEQANLALLIVTPDVLSISQSKRVLATLQDLGFPLRMIKVILNRSESLASINWREIKETLPVEICVRIPSQGRIALEGINQGMPIVLGEPKSRISVAIRRFSDYLTDGSIFLRPQTIDQLRLKNVPFQRQKDFWEKMVGIAMPLAKKEKTPAVDAKMLFKQRIHNLLIERLNLRRLSLETFSDAESLEQLKHKAGKLVSELLAEESGGFLNSQEERNQFSKEMVEEALGLGPLEDLLKDPTITDVMVNNKDEIYIERAGKIELTDKKFISNEQVRVIIERIIAPLGRRIDESNPMVDARLPDGSRVNAVIPPLSLTGPCVAIRKFTKESLTTDDLRQYSTLNQSMAEFIKACVLARKNIIVSGGTGSGKTTVLNVLSCFIPEGERIITIEDAAELKLTQSHWVRLESRPPNIEGKGAIVIRDLFRNSLRMRPDRIIIGECRGLETLDMLQAMNTGHDGSMTTVHANSTQDVLTRLDSMILMSGVELPIRAIREMIAAAIDIIVHTARLSDGSRKIVQITEMLDMVDEFHIGMQDIFVFRQTGIDSKGNITGNFEPTGTLPTFFEDMQKKGIPLSKSLFKNPA